MRCALHRVGAVCGHESDYVIDSLGRHHHVADKDVLTDRSPKPSRTFVNAVDVLPFSSKSVFLREFSAQTDELSCDESCKKQIMKSVQASKSRRSANAKEQDDEWKVLNFAMCVCGEKLMVQQTVATVQLATTSMNFTHKQAYTCTYPLDKSTPSHAHGWVNESLTTK